MDKKGYHLAHDASQVISEEYIGLLDSAEYNLAVSHVNELIQSAYVLFMSGQFAPSVFLSITIFEEVAKIKSGHMRSWGEQNLREVKRHKDPLFNHGKKHKIAVDPVYLIGSRIANSISETRAKEFFAKYESGEYSRYREEALYFARSKRGLHIPSSEIGLSLAAEHLLVAIEIFSDEFWGMTAEASEICDTTDALYLEVESQLKNN
ncbi:AbiV family abortive infection protein [Vibrio splendidus]|uniref:AbiV family abortive infection protein n=1 Tax=Vibrio splendidus TaxID=29497 RepID=UPI00076A515E|nr:AbiV family abortive infection protein [Vibrio splendidus]